MAEALNKTVHELLNGERAPLSSSELRMWSTYFKVKRHYSETQKN